MAAVTICSDFGAPQNKVWHCFPIYFPWSDFLELTPQKDVLFIIGDWNAKVGSQETPGKTGKFVLGVQNETEQRLVLPRECTGHSKHPLPKTQEKTLHMAITRWSTPKSEWLYSLQPKMEKLYTVSKNKTRADCGSDHELLIAKLDTWNSPNWCICSLPPSFHSLLESSSSSQGFNLKGWAVSARNWGSLSFFLDCLFILSLWFSFILLQKH